jgi:hypothetical protein
VKLFFQITYFNIGGFAVSQRRAGAVVGMKAAQQRAQRGVALADQAGSVNR